MDGEPRDERWVLIFDGACEFCRRQVSFVERHDLKRRIEAVPFQAADIERFGVSREAAEEAMHLVAPSGDVWRGAAAARETLRQLPRLRPAAWLFRLPGAMFIAERIYGWIARRRHRYGCESETCRRGAGSRSAKGS